MARPNVLELFSSPVAAWFGSAFPAPTAAQTKGWPAIATGEHTLILAPTGSGKTLTAFLWALNRLTTTPPPEASARTRLVYISPLRALAVDVDKNLRAPLAGIVHAAEGLGVPVHRPEVGIRTGDSSPEMRRNLVRRPPDILITTPESLYLMLTSRARESLVNVETVIIDEIHALAATKRGAHLAVSLERLNRITKRAPQRIGLSATQRPLEEIARFLGGFEIVTTQHPDPDPNAHHPGHQNTVQHRTDQHRTDQDGAACGNTVLDDTEPDDTERDGTDRHVRAGGGGVGVSRRARTVRIVDAGVRKTLELEVVVPVEDLANLGQPADAAQPGAGQGGSLRRSIWPAMHPRLLELVLAHRSTIIFVNNRRLAERLASRLNELDAAGEGQQPTLVGAEATGTSSAASDGELVLAHHGSLSRERRLHIEDRLKTGDLRGLVATSSLELGIDMGAVDLVIQVSSPGAVSTGLQRIGRAGHQVGEASRGKLFPRHRADLLEAAVVAQRMQDGLIEATRYPRNPLDVACQQIVAMAAMDDVPLEELATVLRGAANFAELSDEQLHNVLDLLAGRYPSESFGELRPRIIWDRLADVIKARPGAQRLAVTNAGTIPDRGLYGVFLPDGSRVGELDEEMVYESRVGETFLLGASTWRIEDITFDRVIVTPAPGQPGKMPFWHGDGPGRPLELGQAIGTFLRMLRGMDRAEAAALLQRKHSLDGWAATNLLTYLEDQVQATGALPDDRTIVVERFRDEIGDWRVCVLCPFGAQVLAPWGMALRHRLAEAWGYEPEMLWSDDGIVIRLPETETDLPLDALAIDPEDIDAAVVAALPSSAMFAARFREAAGRALLLPRRRPDQRTPLWQQRQRAADLLTVAARFPAFPLLLETTRECLNDVFDLPALRQVLGDIRTRRIRMVAVETDRASPFAASLLFGWIAVFMYEGDAPLAERRAAALTLDRELLTDLLGAEELRELLDPEVLIAVEAELQLLTTARRIRQGEGLWDALRWLGPLTTEEVEARSEEGITAATVAGWITRLVTDRRVIPLALGGRSMWAAAEDAGRLRDGLGCAIPTGLPAAYTESGDHPFMELVACYARTHGPFLTTEVAQRLGVSEVRVSEALDALVASGRVVSGEFRSIRGEGATADGPAAVRARELCDAEVLRQLRRRSLAALRREVEPTSQQDYARFLQDWQGLGATASGIDALADAIAQLAGAAIPASVLETDVLAARVRGYHAADLDSLCTAGEVIWVGAGGIGSNDGRVRLAFRDQAPLLLAASDPADTDPANNDPANNDGSLGDGLHRALLGQLQHGGASFWADLVAAAHLHGQPTEEPTVLAALWDLVWAGLVTNDSLTPLRALLRGPGATRTGKAAAAVSGRARRGARLRPRPGQLSRSGPPAGAGRWSLVAPLLAPAPSPTEALTARAMQLLERYGVLTREAALGEGAEGGFAGVYPVLKALEERGQVRRGYFVEGLGAAQFALPGAVDRLRGHRRSSPPGSAKGPVEMVMLAATDPAQPYGAALDWPVNTGRPSRSAGAQVVLADGEPLAYLERSGRSLLVFPRAEAHPGWPVALSRLVGQGRHRQLEIARINGVEAAASLWAPALRAFGFRDGYRGLVLREGQGPTNTPAGAGPVTDR
ncbi:MAG: DEAD/DEAH box helicase [Acidimicrobiales bacterium]